MTSTATDTMTDAEKAKKRERYIRIIQGLQKLAADDGSTEAEAMACMGKAQFLMEQEGITSMMLADPEEMEKQADIKRKTIYRHSARRMPTWLLNLAGGVAWANRCRYWYSGGSIVAAGTEDNLMKMDLMLTWLVGEVSRLYKEEKPSWLDRSEGKRWANSFRLGCANKIAQRSCQARRDAKKAAQENTPEKMYEKALAEGDTAKILEMDKQNIKVGDTKYALARVNYAIARMDEDETRAKTWVDDTMQRKCSKCYGGGCKKCNDTGKVSSFGKGTPRNHYGTAGAAFSTGTSAGARADLNSPKGHIS